MMKIKVLSLAKAASLAGLLVTGCAGSADRCAEVALHLESCAGINLQVPETCDPYKVELLLQIPCERMSQARRTFAFGWPEHDWQDAEYELGAWLSTEEWQSATVYIPYDDDFVASHCQRFGDVGAKIGQETSMINSGFLGGGLGFGAGALLAAFLCA